MNIVFERKREPTHTHTHHAIQLFKTFRRLKQAFTLVELMTVIFVITVLIVLAVPLFRGIREMAEETRCKNNLKQFGVAMNEFMSDHAGLIPGYVSARGHIAQSDKDVELKIGDDMPRSFSLKSLNVTQDLYGGDSSGGTDYDDFISDYVSSIGNEPSPVLICPTTDPTVFTPGSANFKGYFTDPTTGDHYDTYVGYSINAYVQGCHKANIPGDAMAVIERNPLLSWDIMIDGLSRSVYRMERANIKNQYMLSLRNPTIDDGRSKSDQAMKTDVGFHHRRGNEMGANYVCMDGHVDWVSSNNISTNVFKGSDDYF